MELPSELLGSLFLPKSCNPAKWPLTFSFDLLFERLSSDLNQLTFSGFASGDSFFGLSDEVRLSSNGLALGVDRRRRIEISVA